MRDRLAAIPSSFSTSDGKRLTARAYVFLVLLCFGLFSPGLATLPPTDRDESSFAQATKQMIESGNYLDIRLREKPRYQKPVGIYWMQAASVWVLNHSHANEIWAYRVPSLIGGTIAVIMTAMTGALLFGANTGILAAIILAGCVGLNVEAHLAKTDAVLLGLVTTAQYALLKAYRGVRGWKNACLFWGAIGIGFLVKGPIILLVAGSTLLWLHVTEKNLKWFGALKPKWGMLLALLLIVPWFAAIAYMTHGDFFEKSAGHDMLAKIWEGQNHGRMPPGLHLLIFPLVFFPFSLLAVLAVPDAWANRTKPAVRFCLGWIIPTWMVFELSMTKLPQYALPTYPAIAILAAKALEDGFPILAERGSRWYKATTATVWLLIGMAIALTLAYLPYGMGGVVDVWQMIAGGVLILTQGVSLLMLSQRKTGCVPVMAAGMTIFMAILLGHTLPNLKHVWLSNEIVREANTMRPCVDLQIASTAYNEPSLTFLAGTRTIMSNDISVTATELKKNMCSVAVVDDEHKQAFLNSFSGNKAQPHAVTTLSGYNIGHGGPITLTIYDMERR